MHSSVMLLTTMLIAAAPGDGAPDTKAIAPVTAAQAMTAPMPSEVPPDKPTMGQRLRNFFMPPRAVRAERPEVPMLEPREAHPNAAPATKASAKIVPAKASAPAPTTTVTAMRPNFDLAEKDLKQVGHETDYSWITGKLFRAPSGSGRYVIRYTAPYEEDRYGGAVLLGSSPVLANYHEGDLICVHGKVLGGSSARSAANAVYEVHSVDLIERASH
jgi:hypothetical protein